jgi:hypothetical protein
MMNNMFHKFMFLELHWPGKTLHMRPSGPNTVPCNH